MATYVSPYTALKAWTAAGVDWTAVDPNTWTVSNPNNLVKQIDNEANDILNIVTNTFVADAAYNPIQTGTYTGYRAYAGLFDVNGVRINSNDNFIVFFRIGTAAPDTKAAISAVLSVCESPAQTTAGLMRTAGVNVGYATTTANFRFGATTLGVSNQTENANHALCYGCLMSAAVYLGNVQAIGTNGSNVFQTLNSRNANQALTAATDLSLILQIGAATNATAGVDNSNMRVSFHYAAVKFPAFP